ncbi:hypothetical protein SAMN05421538_10371 [Paracoccus isoporae]|uniref:Uncharacterized protein n=1 Tax=Paracoccus isoporae TaxID=591205 RepID=A0A1G6YW90_9RHOB|nr:hypothetical protein [Paracoccus isoporae]SDD93897.1 hypothetical protein SAMN05421538_10371 [Paracoccus isoporae]
MAETKVEGSGDCGNSPKNRLAQEIAVGLETGGLSRDLLAEDVVWQRADGREIAGAEAVLAALSEVQAPRRVVVDHAISHGKVGAANGISTGRDGKARGFAHVIGWSSTSAKKVAVVRSYGVG